MNKLFSSSSNSRWWDLPAAFLLLLILTTAFMRLVATEWTDHLIVTRFITYLGLAAGLALGFSVFSSRRVVFFAFIYGLFVILWRVGVTMGEGISWQERLLSLVGRIGVIVTNLIQQKAAGVVDQPVEIRMEYTEPEQKEDTGDGAVEIVRRVFKGEIIQGD